VSLEVEAIAVLLNVSLQLLQDAEFDVAADVLADFMEAFAYRLDWSCLQADGTADATDGGMTGVFAGGTAVTAASGNTSVETTDFEDWTKVILGVDAGVLSRPCRWWMHPHILVRALSVKDSNGRPIFLTATEAPTPGGIGSLLGYPVTPAHAAPNTNAASAKIAVFGDPNAYVVGLRRDFEFAASDQHKWDTLQRSFRGVGRAGTKMRKASALAVMTLPAE
jgi:HK97 family phage major capsid protein